MKHVALVACLFAGCTLAGDKNRCETQADCLDGYTCTAAGTCEQTMSTCTPATCDGRCGTLANGDCGGTIDCGACPDHCANSVQDPTETDLNCGGDCAPCALGQHCGTTLDCQSGTCDAGTCRAGRWSTIPPMPTARRALAAVVGADGLIYAIGGDSAGGRSGVVEAYDPMSTSWTTRAPMPTPRSGLAAVVGADGTIYAIGGDYGSVNDAGPSVVAEAYTPSTNTWRSLPALPVGRYEVAAAADGSGTIYAIGGFDGLTFTTLGSVATWQPGAQAWAILPDAMTTARSEHASATMPDGKIYALGGEHGAVTAELGAFEYYQPGGSGWHTLPAMPTPRRWLAAVGIGTRLFAIGGNRGVAANLPYTSVVEVFDTGTQAWSQVASLPTGRFGHAAVVLGGKIYVIGGQREDTESRTATVDVYTPDL